MARPTILAAQALSVIVMSIYHLAKENGTNHWGFRCVLCATVFVSRSIDQGALLFV